MAGMKSLIRNFGLDLAKRKQELRGCTSVDLYASPNTESRSLFIAFLRTDETLWERTAACRSFTFPMELLHNTKFLMSLLRKPLRAGNLQIDCSELAAAILSYETNDPLNTAKVLPDENLFEVPIAAEDDAFEGQEFAIDEAKAWAAVLFATDWKQQRRYGLSSKKVPSFYAIHIPDKPYESITTEEWHTAAIMMLGWNYARADGRMGNSLAEFAKNFADIGKEAWPIATL